VNIVHQYFVTRQAACGDPRDRDPIQLGGPLSATRCGIGPSQSQSATQQTATNQQVAVSGGGTAVGARTNTISKTGAGSATIVGAGNTAITLGAKSTLNTNTSTVNQTNSNNRVTTSNSNNTTVNNSGTSNVTNTYGDDAATIAALNAVTNQGAQSEDAISGLADTITQAFDTVATLFTASPQTGSVGYVSTPQSNTPAAPAAVYTQDTTGTSGSGLTQNEVIAIIAAIVVIGGIMIFKN
jgi:hypothetical protein